MLKNRMLATQQASELEVGNAAYETLFQTPSNAPQPKVCKLPISKLHPFFTADIGFKPYTFANIVKTENPVEETKVHTEIITIETAKKDLSVVLENLEPTIEFDDGNFKGTLALDHTSIVTEAAGYTTKSYTVTETKTIGQLDRNDMSYVPSTTVKDGRTLNLANVEWQVTGTDLVGEALMPSSYQAIAAYGKIMSKW